MKDEVLERIWKSRKAIAAQCDFDTRKLVKFYQERAAARREKMAARSGPRQSSERKVPQE